MTYSAAGHGELLRLVYEQKARTRFELAKLTGLSRSAATQRVDALLNTGLLIEDGATATAGRRATNFSFNTSARVLLAADIGVNRTRTMVTDLAARPLPAAESDFDVAVDRPNSLATSRNVSARICRRPAGVPMTYGASESPRRGPSSSQPESASSPRPC